MGKAYSFQKHTYVFNKKTHKWINRAHAFILYAYNCFNRYIA